MTLDTWKDLGKHRPTTSNACINITFYNLTRYVYVQHVRVHLHVFTCKNYNINTILLVSVLLLEKLSCCFGRSQLVYSVSCSTRCTAATSSHLHSKRRERCQVGRVGTEEPRWSACVTSVFQDLGSFAKPTEKETRRSALTAREDSLLISGRQRIRRHIRGRATFRDDFASYRGNIRSSDRRSGILTSFDHCVDRLHMHSTPKPRPRPTEADRGRGRARDRDQPRRWNWLKSCILPQRHWPLLAADMLRPKREAESQTRSYRDGW